MVLLTYSPRINREAREEIFLEIFLGLHCRLSDGVLAVKKNFDNIDEYIATFPKNVQMVLQQTRKAVRALFPKPKS